MGRIPTSPPSAGRSGSRGVRFARPIRRPFLLILPTDVVMLGAATLATLVAPLTNAGSSPFWTVTYSLAVVATLAGRGEYIRRPRWGLLDQLGRVLKAVLLVTMAVISLRALATGDGAVAAAPAGSAVYACAFLAVGRIAASLTLVRALRRRGVLRPTLILGAGKVGNLAAKRLLDRPELGLEPVGFLDDDPLEIPGESSMLPVLGAPPDLDRIVADHGIEHFIVGFSMASHQMMLGLVRRCWELGVSVAIVPRLFEVEGDRVVIDRLGGLPLVSLDAPLSSEIALAAKYAFDRVAAAVALVVLSPILAGLAVAVRFSMGSPVMYKQRRVGRDGQHFVMWKFRTMSVPRYAHRDANEDWARAALQESALEPASSRSAVAESESCGALAVENRETPLGRRLRRFSLDELPQLWNVLRGDMSLIGPRPELPQYVERFEEGIYRYSDRLRVKSGMTGWAQVNGLRGDTSLVDRVEWDNYYIENWSPWLDVKIALLTLGVFRGSDSTTGSPSNGPDR